MTIWNWVMRFIPTNAVENAKKEADHLRRIALAVASSLPVRDMAQVVAHECKEALEADAISVHLLMPDGHFEMLAAIGCSEEWQKDWKRVPKDSVAFAQSSCCEERLFFGSAEDFKAKIPSAATLVDRSARKTIAYAPLIVSNQSIGVIGFSYNRKQSIRSRENFILILVNLCAQALERARLTEQEHLARRAAESASQAKTDFLANISHEIRTPLGVILGFTDLLAERGDLPSECQEWVATVRRNTTQLSNIIGDVLDISKIEAKTLEIEDCEFSLPDMLLAVCKCGALNARSKNLRFNYSSGQIPECVVGDETRIRQILENLVTNAVKFTKQGEVTVHSHFEYPDTLAVLVADTGVGIDLSQQSRIFEPFTQGHTSNSREFGGTGLGLAIAKHLAASMGGSVSLLDSTPGRGSTFQMKIKCRVVNRQPGTFARHAKKIDRGNSLEGARVLLVEDSADNRELIGYILGQEGASVEMAADAETGVKMALNNGFDLVLMDIQMPGADGYEAVHRLRQHGYSKPVIALSARAMKSDVDEGLRMGFDDYLTKPIDRPGLIGRLSNLRSATLS